MDDNVVFSTNIFNLDDRDRVAVMIDGFSIFNGAKALDFQIDYTKLISHLHGAPLFTSRKVYVEPTFNIIDIRYYNNLIRNQDNNTVPLQPLYDWLGYNGVFVQLRERRSGDSGPLSYIVDMTIDALNLMSNVDHFVFFTSEVGFSRLFHELRRSGKKVTLVCAHSLPTARTDSGFVGVPTALRQSVNKFIDLHKLAAYLMSKQKSDGENA